MTMAGPSAALRRGSRGRDAARQDPLAARGAVWYLPAASPNREEGG